ncbi:sigma-70 family RNA polymerase sigma factor [Actinoplanes sp. NPDC051470]|uniref:sigma-70 family RNA polymerase sigma factor n=1 Tax=unclassified Actinoplanes TaxID=2626549 RepID=UPI00344022C1
MIPFDDLVAPLRRELHAHCYRMLGSSHDADDAVQEALVRAWRGMDRFEGRGSARSWLYTIATRTCLDLIEKRGRRALPMDLGPASDHTVLTDAPVTEVAWLGPYPDAGLRAEERESVELAFVAALQHLPGNQRAALLLVEVLGFSAAEVAELMATTPASVNSALQRARSAKLPSRTQQQVLRKLGDAGVRSLVTSFADALEQGDADGLVALLTKDVTWSMPPMAHWYAGLGAVTDFAIKVPLTSCGRWQHRPVAANGQPAVASYLEGRFWSINVFTVAGDRIESITSFLGDDQAALFGLPLHPAPA